MAKDPPPPFMLLGVRALPSLPWESAGGRGSTRIEFYRTPGDGGPRVLVASVRPTAAGQDGRVDLGVAEVDWGTVDAVVLCAGGFANESVPGSHVLRHLVVTPARGGPAIRWAADVEILAGDRVAFEYDFVREAWPRRGS